MGNMTFVEHWPITPIISSLRSSLFVFRTKKKINNVQNKEEYQIKSAPHLLLK